MTDKTAPPLLVLGATSLIGRALDRRESRPGWIRVSRSAPAQAQAGWLRADLGDEGLDRVLAAVGPFEMALGLAPIWTVAPAVPALARAGVRRLVAFSSTSRWTKQNSPVESERAVARSLADAEQSLIAACEAHGIAWTILRPTLIYDEGHDGNVTRLAGLIRRFGFLPLSGGGAGLRQPVHAEDLGWAALAALDAPASFNKAYDLPGGETLSYRQMAARIFEALGKKPLILDLPGFVWSLAFFLARPFLPGATAAMGTRMSEDLAFDPEPAARDFGWRPRDFRPRFVA